LGEAPGVVLQASYLEAILDGRIVKKIGETWQILAALAFWCVVETRRTIRSKTAAFLLLLLGVAALNLLIVTFLGYYGDFTSVSMAGTAILLILELHGRLTGKHA